MIPIVKVKQGVLFTTIAPGGFCILSAIQRTCIAKGYDLTITSACDGEHSGPNDPHHRGEAFDLRTNDLNVDQKTDILKTIIMYLGDKFYAFLESPNTPNEHIHIQVAKGTTYP